MKKLTTNPHNIDNILIFWNCQVRGAIYKKNKHVKITWEPWKLKFLPDPAKASLETYKSIFLFSGLPKFVRQGCHISVGYKDRISKIIPDIGQNVNLKCPVTGIFVAFCLTSSCFCWSVLNGVCRQSRLGSWSGRRKD